MGKIVIFLLLGMLNNVIYSEQLVAVIKNIDDTLNEKNAVYEIDFNIVRDKIVNKYKLTMWYKNKNFVAVVKYPSSEKGTVFLMWKGGAWVYYPSIQKRIKLNPKHKILNSDFSFYEISGLNLLEDYYHKEISVNFIKEDKRLSEFLSEETLSEVYMVVELNALKKLNFAKVILLINKDNNLLGMLLYNNAMNLCGILEYKNYMEISNKIKPKNVILKNIIHRNSYTEIIYKNAEYSVEIPDYYFSPTYMENISNKE